MVQKLLRKGRKGTRIIYVPGNHDEFLRNYYGTHFGGIEVVEQTMHDGADGKRYLIIHGDIFDLVVQNARWLAHLGDRAYDFAIQMNRFVNMFRRMFGRPYWSLSQWAKLKVKNAVNYIGAFERTLAAEARRCEADGVICGHIHFAAIRDEHGIRYINCGDWVESCTAVVEHEDGTFEIINWANSLAAGVRAAPLAVRPPDESPRRHRRLASAGQWCGADADDDVGARPRRSASRWVPHAAVVPHGRDAGLSRHPPRAAAPGDDCPADRGGEADAIHIATEGPIGMLVRRYCRRHGLAVSSSFHTRFPEYVSARLPVPESWVWAMLRWFHSLPGSVMAATPPLAQELCERGFRNVRIWPRGVDAKLFRPRTIDLCFPRPVFLSVGRLAVEKNLEAFLDLDLPGTKVVVGDGPQRASLQRRYRDAVFLGEQFGEQLAETYAAADVFVFPSKTDTFGLVLLEALASGVPVAAFPVTGPRDVIGNAPVGVLNEDLREACLAALGCRARTAGLCAGAKLGSLRAGFLNNILNAAAWSRTARWPSCGEDPHFAAGRSPDRLTCVARSSRRATNG